MTHRHSPHTRCHVGKRVWVGLRDGTQFTDHFKRETNTAVWLRERGKVTKQAPIPSQLSEKNSSDSSASSASSTSLS